MAETVLNDIPEYSNIKYKKLAFVPEDLSKVGVGQLRKVVYQFNIPGFMDPDNPSWLWSLIATSLYWLALLHDASIFITAEVSL